jgi:hypothetical protein
MSRLDLSIERDARFVEVEEREPGALPFGVNGARGAAITVRRLDFQDGRAEIGEQTRAVARRSAPDLDDRRCDNAPIRSS